MASITKLKLGIKKGSTHSVATVSYRICFTHCEATDKSTYIESIRLMGDDAWPNPDDNLTKMYSRCVQASSNCLNRKVVRKIKNSILNEDDTFWNRQDEIFARVTLTPFKPSKASATSNIVNSYF